MRIAGVIPARWGSTRFPGKSLALIRGRPLIARVIERVRRARRLDAVLVATDDARIAAVAADCGAVVAMTRPDHPSGTDRIAEAVAGRGFGVVVNIQGDEPLIDPDLVDRLAGVLQDDPAWEMATAASPMTDAADVANPSVVKVVCDERGGALYFSRAAIPFYRDGAPGPAGAAYWRHIGIYAYRAEFLVRMVAHAPSPLELAEKLEQLRALQMGARIRVLQEPAGAPGVDTPGDVAKVEARMAELEIE